ncbi:hypothetical protein COLO4_24523 [Corchorus olitorius]|uniref:Uncharacterized protein n=1 Tax=Corchorus olitorius TaxID=93759 RepID=A0A1R3I9B6_9ROSI|nr:hypothetical protein COLO4_24523 [Corchorus olitorius]
MDRISQKLKECSRWKGGIGLRIWRVIEKNTRAANYCEVYNNVLQPMPGRTDWLKAPGNPVAIKPPPFKRLPGRPVTQRRKKKDEPNKDKDDGPNLSRKGPNSDLWPFFLPIFCQENPAENQPDKTSQRESNSTQRSMSHPVNEATTAAGGDIVDATASGAFVVHENGPAAPSSSTTFFNVSATGRSTSSQRPATDSVIITAPVSSPAPTQTAAKKSKSIKLSTQRPIPKILRMPAPSGRSWQDASGWKFHGGESVQLPVFCQEKG